MSDLIVALGLVLVIEGLAYAIAPEAIKRMLQSVESIPPSLLRAGGLVAASIGVVVVWLARH